MPSKKKRKGIGGDDSRRHSFLELIATNPELASLRREYAAKPPEERRMAADWDYNEAIAVEMFDEGLARAGLRKKATPKWPPGVTALAVDPTYAPAMLTVGSLEYLNGRIPEAMDLFLQLTRLPLDEPDRTEIIDKAGDFLLDREDYLHALALYEAAEAGAPGEPPFMLGTGYSLSKLGRLAESVEKHRAAVALDPQNSRYLNDLGYTLMLAGELEEAEEVLLRSLAFAPPGYEFPSNNLDDLRERKRKDSPGKEKSRRAVRRTKLEAAPGEASGLPFGEADPSDAAPPQAGSGREPVSGAGEGAEP